MKFDADHYYDLIKGLRMRLMSSNRHLGNDEDKVGSSGRMVEIKSRVYPSLLCLLEKML